MKKTLLATLLLGTGLIVKAQFTEPGQKVLGSSISINTSEDNSTVGALNKQTSFAINFIAGKFVKKNVLSSIKLSYQSQVYKAITATNTNKIALNSFAGSYSKTYYKEIAKKLYFGIGGNIVLSYSYQNNMDMFKSKIYQIGLGLYPTCSYQLTNRLMFNLSPSAGFFDLNYYYYTSKIISSGQTISPDHFSTVNLNTGFWNSPLSNILIGFSYLLKNK